jgi:hypothetical protein
MIIWPATQLAVVGSVRLLLPMKGKTLEACLDDFEGVPREEAIAALEQACER